jgi:hypothetical protein
MKKLYTTLVAVIAITQFSYAQWTGGPTGNVYYNGGNVGIGTAAPNYPLTLNSAAETGILTINNGTSLYLSHGGWSMGAGKFGIGNGVVPTLVVNTVANGGSAIGNVGIGTTTPQRRLDISNAGQLTFGDDVVTSSSNGIYWHSGNSYGIYRTSGPWTGGAYQQLRIQFDTGIQLGAGTGVNAGFDKSFVEIVSGKGLMVSSGNVGIGTTDPQGYKLAVNGSAIAESVTVKLHTNWPDYVFKKEYKLPSLLEVKAYIDQNQHLPEMPSEQEVSKNGINLGEINKILTKKVEELTLYAIDQKEQLTQQEKKAVLQEARITALEKALSKLTAND